MKSTKIFSSIVGMIAVVLGMTSCLNSDTNGLEQTFNLNKFVNVFEDNTVMSGVSYKYTIFYEKNTARMEISGLKFPDNTAYSTIVLEDLKLSSNSTGWLIISGENVAAAGASGYAPSLMFDKFTFEIHDNAIGTAGTNGFYNTPYVNLTYTVNGYHVRSLPSAMINQGTTTVTSRMGEPFISNSPIYATEINMESGKADITIEGAKFADKMPALNMKFSGIPVTLNSDGDYTLKIDELIPTIIGADKKETPYPNYPITDLQMSLNPASGMNLHFVCTIISESIVDGEEVKSEMPFDVNVVARMQNPR